MTTTLAKRFMDSRSWRFTEKNDDRLAASKNTFSSGDGGRPRTSFAGLRLRY
jgi:hypothetical protein